MSAFLRFFWQIWQGLPGTGDPGNRHDKGGAVTR